MTTLELARAIATAVLRQRDHPRERESSRDRATQAVLRTLHRTGHWFSRSDHDADGIALAETETLCERIDVSR